MNENTCTQPTVEKDMKITKLRASASGVLGAAHAGKSTFSFGAHQDQKYLKRVLYVELFYDLCQIDR